MPVMTPGNRKRPLSRPGGALLGFEHLERRTLFAIGAEIGLPAAASISATVDPGPMLPAGEVIEITGDQHDQLRLVDPGDDAVIDLTQATFFGLEDVQWLEAQPVPLAWPTHTELDSITEASNEEKFPVSIRGTSARLTIQGGTIIGQLKHQAPWHVWKMHADGDGLRVEGDESYEIDGTRIHNVADAIAPRGSQSAVFDIHDVYATSIHDDAVENDEIHSGSISDSFFKTHTFLSARPTSGSNISNPSAVVTVENCVVHLLLQPHQGGTGGPTDINTAGGYPFDDGLGTGSIFKFDWGTTNSGTVVVRNTVFLIERNSASSKTAMQFAPGTYENVTVVWLGGGDYPWAAPTGVTITSDRTAYDQAKAAFFAAHPEFEDQSRILSLDADEDGFITESDAEFVLAALNEHGAGSVPIGMPSVDINRDNFLTPLDVLYVINAVPGSNFANFQAPATSQAVSPSAAIDSASGELAFALALGQVSGGGSLTTQHAALADVGHSLTDCTIVEAKAADPVGIAASTDWLAWCWASPRPGKPANRLVASELEPGGSATE